MTMEIIRIPRIMQDTSRAHILRGRNIGLVPTMGALHDGHMSLIRLSMMENHHTVASIFVNPTQFGPGEDFEQYPRDADADIKKLRDAGVDYLLMPDSLAMYPEGYSTSVSAGPIGDKLCGAFRPGHFDAVATVVVKLLNIALPTRAYFGQKDYQQSAVIRKVVKELNMPVEVVICPTIRDADGLAMSSRNQYLSTEEKKAAGVINITLQKAAEMLKSGTPAGEVSDSMKVALAAEPLVAEVQYAGVYDPETLEDLAVFGRKALLAVAVRIGRSRLIDNVLI